MKRERHSRSHAPVLGGQLVERGNRLVVAQHDRDLAATGYGFGLAFGAGFWLGHGLVAGSEEGAELRGRNFMANQFRMLGGEVGPRMAVFTNKGHGRAKGDGIAGAEGFGREVGGGEHHGWTPLRTGLDYPLLVTVTSTVRRINNPENPA